MPRLFIQTSWDAAANKLSLSRLCPRVSGFRVRLSAVASSEWAWEPCHRVSEVAALLPQASKERALGVRGIPVQATLMQTWKYFEFRFHFFDSVRVSVLVTSEDLMKAGYSTKSLCVAGNVDTISALIAFSLGVL